MLNESGGIRIELEKVPQPQEIESEAHSLGHSTEGDVSARFLRRVGQIDEIAQRHGIEELDLIAIEKEMRCPLLEERLDGFLQAPDCCTPPFPGNAHDGGIREALERGGFENEIIRFRHLSSQLRQVPPVRGLLLDFRWWRAGGAGTVSFMRSYEKGAPGAH